MRTLRTQLRNLLSIAFLAIFALVFVPTLSRALAHATGDSAWSQICTPQGTKLVAVDGGLSDAPAPQTSGAHLDHCPLCGLGGNLAGPAAAPSGGIEMGLRDEVPPLFLQAPRPLFAWAAAQPRGPPLSF